MISMQGDDLYLDQRDGSETKRGTTGAPRE